MEVEQNVWVFGELRARVRRRQAMDEWVGRLAPRMARVRYCVVHVIECMQVGQVGHGIASCQAEPSLWTCSPTWSAAGTDRIGGNSMSNACACRTPWHRGLT